MANGEKKRILISCGSGIVTSSIARKRIEAFLDSHGYEGRYEIVQVPLASAVEQSQDFDFIVATSLAPGQLKCPYVNGVPYLLGTSTEASDAEILQLMEA